MSHRERTAEEERGRQQLANCLETGHLNATGLNVLALLNELYPHTQHMRHLPFY